MHPEVNDAQDVRDALTPGAESTRCQDAARVGQEDTCITLAVRAVGAASDSSEAPCRSRAAHAQRSSLSSVAGTFTFLTGPLRALQLW